VFKPQCACAHVHHPRHNNGHSMLRDISGSHSGAAEGGDAASWRFSSRRFDGSQCFHPHWCPHSHSDTAADPRRLDSSLYAYSELFLHEDTEVSAENQQVAKDKLTVVLSVKAYPVLSWTVIFSSVDRSRHWLPSYSWQISPHLATYSYDSCSHYSAIYV